MFEMLEFDVRFWSNGHLLGMEAVQRTGGIFVFQKKYVQEILARFEMKNCNL